MQLTTRLVIFLPMLLVSGWMYKSSGGNHQSFAMARTFNLTKQLPPVSDGALKTASTDCLMNSIGEPPHKLISDFVNSSFRIGILANVKFQDAPERDRIEQTKRNQKELTLYIGDFIKKIASVPDADQRKLADQFKYVGSENQKDIENIYMCIAEKLHDQLVQDKT